MLVIKIEIVGKIEAWYLTRTTFLSILDGLIVGTRLFDSSKLHRLRRTSNSDDIITLLK